VVVFVLLLLCFVFPPTATTALSSTILYLVFNVLKRSLPHWQSPRPTKSRKGEWKVWFFTKMNWRKALGSELAETFSVGAECKGVVLYWRRELIYSLLFSNCEFTFPLWESRRPVEVWTYIGRSSIHRSQGTSGLVTWDILFHFVFVLF
jgi:hypothetical protein